MDGALVGGAFLSATLQVLFDRLAHREILDYLQRKEFNQDLLKKLKKKLGSVNAVLNDAEEKQISIPAVREWLDELEDAAYHADDLLDEIAADAVRYKLEAESTTGTSSKVSNMGLISHNSYVSDMENRMKKILEQLELIAKDIDFLGLKVKEGVGENRSRRLPTTSLVDESEVFGRDEEKNAIIKLLLTDDDESGKKVSVIPIVGMGGVGKTTLAKLVYNDDRVEKHFMLKSWVCVSDEFDICKVTKTILTALTRSDSYNDSTDLDLLQTRLKEKLAGKKFLIVLDDIWNETYDDWKDLSMPFNHGAQGSKIIVTTRNEKVADIMRTVPTHYHLQHLKDEDCWNLFAKHAFDNIRDRSAHKVLETIGKEIVKKCNGLPLAAKTLGGLLRSKEDVREWEKILKSEIWEFSNRQSKILPVLMLSYHDLPSHLKRCFAFCSIFPKDYEFQKHELVLLWMAENLLHQSKRNKRLEDVGYEYFNELLSRSFFQKSNGGEKSCFVIHDLIHDLAQYVSREYCFTLEVENPQEAAMKVRHLALSRDPSFKILDFISKATHLRTFLPSFGYSLRSLSNEAVNHIILKFRCLRVLKLPGCPNLNQLPESTGELKHLRFLDLSLTPIKSLPESVSKLYNLQILKLSYCYQLTELPKNMHHLVNLRHLDIRHCSKLVEMPRQISKLKSLQTLTTFIVGEDDGVKIGELGVLSDLSGELSLQNLQNIANAKDASKAKLVDKKNLEGLRFFWEGDTKDSKHERDVLDALSPHQNLEWLHIVGYGGTRFPNWLWDDMFCNIVSIDLESCKYCNSLPPLGQLPSLQHLEIGKLDGVVSVGAEFYRINDSSVRKPFASLESLSFCSMTALEEWRSIEVEDGEVFPKLRELRIRDCDRLVTLDFPHNLPCLTTLVIESEFEEVLIWSLPRTPTLRELELGRCEKLEIHEVPQTVEFIRIGGCDGIKSWIKALVRSSKSQTCCLQHVRIESWGSSITFPAAGCLPTSLTRLEIWNCDKLELPAQQQYSSIERVTILRSCGGWLELFPLDLFPNLKDLSILECENVECLRASDGHMTSLSDFYIRDCPNFMSFPKGGLHAPNLTQLSVCGCKKLKALPEQMRNLLPCLKILSITYCPEVESFPEGGLPSNLTHFVVYGCKKLKALPEHMHNLPFLENFEIKDCPEVESFPEGGLPSNLRELTVERCSKLIAKLKKWNLQTLQALKELTICGDECECENEGGFESFPEEGLLPSTLTSLDIIGFKSLKRVDIKGLQQLSSLKHLSIIKCPQLQNLPQLPTSLTELCISSCHPILTERCQRETWEDWNNISHILYVSINNVRVV